jgi:hypothetical protein
MGNDNMVTNQKVFIRLEKVLELQRILVRTQAEFYRHSAIASKDDVRNEEAYSAMQGNKDRMDAMRDVIAMLELPITL